MISSSAIESGGFENVESLEGKSGIIKNQSFFDRIKSNLRIGIAAVMLMSNVQCAHSSLFRQAEDGDIDAV